MEMESHNPYQAPAAAIADSVAPVPAAARVSGNVHAELLFAPSGLKLIVMSLCTFNLYAVYWFYRNWKAIKIADRENLMPFWRAFFSPLWAYSCFKRLRELAQSRRRQLAFSPGALALAFFLLNLASRAPLPYALLSFLAFMPLLPVNSLVRDFRRAEGADHGRDDRFGVANWLAVVLGGGITLLALFGLMLEG